MNRFAVLMLAVAGPALAEAPKVTPQLLEKGKTLFVSTCAPCHGEKGDATGPAAAALNPKPRNFHQDPFKQGSKREDIFNTATNGVPGTAMVGFPAMAEEDRWAIGGRHGRPNTPARIPQQSSNQLFNLGRIACHRWNLFRETARPLHCRKKR